MQMKKGLIGKLSPYLHLIYLVFMLLPPYTSHLSKRLEPSEYGPTTEVLSFPASSNITILCGGTDGTRKEQNSSVAAN